MPAIARRHFAKPRTKPEITWSNRPLIREHALLGRKRIWNDLLRHYQITQFPATTGLFVAWYLDQKIAEKHSLNGAKKACLNHRRENGDRQ